MHQKVEGIVLNAVTTGDNDRLCTILTDKLGVIAAYAKGARNMKNKNFTATAQFVYGSFDLFRHRGSFTIDESEYEELNLGLRDDIVRLSVAQYLCQLSMELAPEGEAAGEYLPVLRAAFYYLCGETRDPKLIKAAAELPGWTRTVFFPLLGADQMRQLRARRGRGQPAAEPWRADRHAPHGAVGCAEAVRLFAQRRKPRAVLSRFGGLRALQA